LGGDVYELTGHKWFCSAPMSDAFLTLAQTAGGLTCFVLPRWRPDGGRNGLEFQRLKDKLGNHANASSEVEFNAAWAQRIGDEGRGVATIIEMVHHTRLDCAVAAAGLMRQAVVQAIHHASHRKAFGKPLIEQPLMRRVLADLALESEAATHLAFRAAELCDQALIDARDAPLARLAVAVAKYWNNKRCPLLIAEAMECLGGAGYVEESLLPRLYREAPLNGIWEGSGNVICLDILRTFSKEPELPELVLGELGPEAEPLLSDMAQAGQQDARQLAGRLARLWQRTLLARRAGDQRAQAFKDARQHSGAFGESLPIDEVDSLIADARPELV
jgi:putative acyl-CoA dehydrogenase